MNGDGHRPFDVLIAEQIRKIGELSADIRAAMEELEAVYGDRPGEHGQGGGYSR